jgi:hypothetical protein
MDPLHPPMSAVRGFDARTRAAPGINGRHDVTSGRCVPPANGSFSTTTSPGAMRTAAMAACTESGVDPRWTGMCAAWATSPPVASKTAHE